MTNSNMPIKFNVEHEEKNTFKFISDTLSFVGNLEDFEDGVAAVELVTILQED